MDNIKNGVSMTIFITGLVVAILISSSLSTILATQYAVGPQGPKGDTGETGPQGEPGIGFEPTGNISVGYSAFVPRYHDNLVNYENGIKNVDSIPFLIMASVQLPHGVTITNVIFYFYDFADDYFLFYLVRENQSYIDVMESVFNLPGSDVPGNTHISFDNNIEYATVDNNNYHYYLEIWLPYSSIDPFFYRFNYAIVEYEYPT